ncbi:MAG: prephenate dehydrogenase [Candidatus Dojkabacteria bacterium]
MKHTNNRLPEIHSSDRVSHPSIGIIGFGKFTELILTIFKEFIPEVQVKIASRSQEIDNKLFFSFEEVCSCDYIIPSVPISAFEETIEKMLPIMNVNAKVIDVCSIKMHPKKVMLEKLPETCEIICTHPNFGPESYRLNNYSAKGLNFIIEFVRCSKATEKQVSSFLEKLGVNLILLDAESHDQKVGVPHFISMLLGILLNRLEITRTPYGAASTQRMFDMVEGVGKDFGILQDMYRYNPFCKAVLKNVRKKFGVIVSEIE